MDALMKIVGHVLEKYIDPVLKWLWQLLSRFIVGVKKMVSPVTDAKTGIKQSRMRYYLVRFSFKNGNNPTAYQEVDSNGNLKRYADSDGKRFIPNEPHQCSVIEEGKFQFPKWARMDWSDVFNGNNDSGCWGISEK